MNIIQKIRSEKGITQEELAKKLAIDRSTIAKWETGKSLPRSNILIKLAQILGCTVDDLLRCEDAEREVKPGGNLAL